MDAATAKHMSPGVPKCKRRSFGSWPKATQPPAILLQLN